MLKPAMATAGLSAAFVGALVLGLAATPAQAAYPARPITLIVPFGAGGGTDLSARLIAPFIEKYMPDGTSIVVVNRPGAGGDVGATEIAQAAPDGYTIGFMNVPNTMMKPHERDTHWTIESFDAIANLVYDPAAIAAGPDSPLKSLDDLVAAARERPGEITVSSAGIGSNTHLDVIALERAADIDLVHVPFEGGAAARNALLGGHPDLLATALGDSVRFHEEGEMVILGVMTEERSPLIPDVPTYAEQGYPAIGGSARGLIAPKGFPTEAIAMIAAATEQALQDPEMLTRAEEMGLPLLFMGTEEYAQFLLDSNAEIAEIWATNPWLEDQ
jgi:tripartite-type tricarboxylate transporter receptor subunit TctC